MRRSLEDIYSVVIGTAGHIDHGKSALVERLTGIHPDRLKEEQERGLTIDLGFAPFRIRGGKTVGIIDVPGHERFVKNMVAGATGIDLVLLVVAADDGVMPQTREHLDIMGLLGVRSGIVALTKIDIVDPEFVELVAEDVQDLVRGTFLEGAPVIPVSSVNGEGISELTEALNSAITALEPRRYDGVFRLPVQRVFSARGFGTVVTGVPISGKVEVGDPVEVLPRGWKGRVRGIQAYMETTDMARAGHSSALNLTDIDYRKVSRGDVVAAPGYFQPAEMVEVRFRYLSSMKRPLRSQTTIRFHAGTAEVLGRIVLLEEGRVEPGADTLAQIRLDAPVVVAPGDRYVVRLHSPMLTIGGGEVLDRSVHRLKVGRARVLGELRRKEEALGSLEAYLRSVVETGPPAIYREEDLAHRLGHPVSEIRGMIEGMVQGGSLVRVRRGAGFMSGKHLREIRQRVVDGIREYYRHNPRSVVVDRRRIRSGIGCPDPFFQEVLDDLAATGDLDVRNENLALSGYRPDLPPDEADFQGLLRERFHKDLFSPPRLEDLARERGIEPAKAEGLLNLLIEEGEFVRLSEDAVFHHEAVPAAAERLREYLEQRESITAAAARELLGTTRRYIIPILETLDRQGVTVRRGDVRTLRAGL